MLRRAPLERTAQSGTRAAEEVPVGRLELARKRSVLAGGQDDPAGVGPVAAGGDRDADDLEVPPRALEAVEVADGDAVTDIRREDQRPEGENVRARVERDLSGTHKIVLSESHRIPLVLFGGLLRLRAGPRPLLRGFRSRCL